jgi:hypothetical protein
MPQFSVGPDYLPPPKVSELPALGKGIVAISTIQGTPPATSDSPAKAIEFSGYEWAAYDEIRDWGGLRENSERRIFDHCRGSCKTGKERGAAHRH